MSTPPAQHLVRFPEAPRPPAPISETLPRVYFLQLVPWKIPRRPSATHDRAMGRCHWCGVGEETSPFNESPRHQLSIQRPRNWEDRRSARNAERLECGPVPRRVDLEPDPGHPPSKLRSITDPTPRSPPSCICAKSFSRAPRSRLLNFQSGPDRHPGSAAPRDAALADPRSAYRSCRRSHRQDHRGQRLPEPSRTEAADGLSRLGLTRALQPLQCVRPSDHIPSQEPDTPAEPDARDDRGALASGMAHRLEAIPAAPCGRGVAHWWGATAAVTIRGQAVIRPHDER